MTTFSTPFKSWVPAAVLVSVVALGGVSTAWSYLRTAGNEIARTVRDTVPIEFELRRLEQLTGEMIPEIQANQKVAAQLDVEIEFLTREINELQQQFEDSRRQMQKLRDALSSNAEAHRFGDRDYSRDEIERDLERRMVSYQDLKLRLEAKERLCDARRRTLDAATAKISACRQQHAMLVEKSGSLHAELKLLELAQATGNVAFDDTKLTQARDLSVELEKRIRTLQRLVEGETLTTDLIPVEADTRPIADQFDELMRAEAG